MSQTDSPTDRTDAQGQQLDQVEPAREAASAEEDFTDIELTELADEQPSGPSFVVPPASAEIINANAEAPADEALPELAGPTQEARGVAASLRGFADNLGDLDGAELTDHVEYYQKAHGELQSALSDIDHA